ncbi:DNA ligase [Anopheles sinensis]|uniref:DNA ligase n=1 Tax=Anopheles sinensis TaxID=74873 RepID=A0A084WP41_ANOSI|nr:DNA ligase [Anopheles sinensis]
MRYSRLSPFSFTPSTQDNVYSSERPQSLELQASSAGRVVADAPSRLMMGLAS